MLLCLSSINNLLLQILTFWSCLFISRARQSVSYHSTMTIAYHNSAIFLSMLSTIKQLAGYIYIICLRVVLIPFIIIQCSLCCLVHHHSLSIYTVKYRHISHTQQSMNKSSLKQQHSLILYLILNLFITLNTTRCLLLVFLWPCHSIGESRSSASSFATEEKKNTFSRWNLLFAKRTNTEKKKESLL